MIVFGDIYEEYVFTDFYKGRLINGTGVDSMSTQIARRVVMGSRHKFPDRFH